jgi:hypothetical protein
MRTLRKGTGLKGSAGILEQSMGARDRVGIGLSYRCAMLHRLAESIPKLHKSLQIPSLEWRMFLEERDETGRWGQLSI